MKELFIVKILYNDAKSTYYYDNYKNAMERYKLAIEAKRFIEAEIIGYINENGQYRLTKVLNYTNN